jgi:hypothetical protein
MLGTIVIAVLIAAAVVISVALAFWPRLLLVATIGGIAWLVNYLRQPKLVATNLNIVLELSLSGTMRYSPRRREAATSA